MRPYIVNSSFIARILHSRAGKKRVWTNRPAAAALALVMALVLPLSGCVKRPSTPTATVEAVLTYIARDKTEKAKALIYNPDSYSLDDSNGIRLNEAVADHLTWELGEESFNSEYSYYIVEATVTTIDISSVLSSLIDQYYDSIVSDATQGISWEDDAVQQKIAEDMNAIILGDDPPLVMQDVEVYVVPDGDDWLVFVTDDFINAVSGGVLDLYEFYAS